MTTTMMMMMITQSGEKEKANFTFAHIHKKNWFALSTMICRRKGCFFQRFYKKRVFFSCENFTFLFWSRVWYVIVPLYFLAPIALCINSNIYDIYIFFKYNMKKWKSARRIYISICQFSGGSCSIFMHL